MARNFGIPQRNDEKPGGAGSYRKAQSEVGKRTLFANDNKPLTVPARGMRWFASLVKRTFGRDQQPRH